MAKISTHLMTYDRALRLEPTEDTFDELRNTLAYLKSKKLPLTVELVNEETVLLGSYFPDSGTHLRLALWDGKITD